MHLLGILIAIGMPGDAGRRLFSYIPDVSLDGKLVLGLLVLLGGMQVVCLLLARGLGRKIERHVAAIGMALPLVFLLPWLDGRRLPLPLDILRMMLPGVPMVEVTHRHDLLNDAVYQFLPWELEVRHALSDGRLPFWSDILEGGSSPWVNPQAGVLSPVALPARILPIQHHLTAALALKLLLAFEGVWLLARIVGVGRAASLLAAGGFALGGGMMAWALFPHSSAAALIPWLTAAVILLFRGGGRRRVAVTALITAAVLLSGHHETAAAGGLFAAVCGISLARRGAFGRGLRSAVLAMALGFALAAPLLLPFALHLPQSQRAQETLARTMPALDPELEDPWSWFLPLVGRFTLSPLGPHVFGRPFQDKFRGPINWVDAGSGYAGLLALAGSAVALLAFRRRRAWPFLGFAAAGMLLATQPIPLAHLTYAIPPLRAMAWSRFLPIVCLALAVAGGMGIDRLLSARKRSPVWIALGVAAALSLAAHTDSFTLLLWAGIGAAALVGRRKPAAALAALAVVLVLDVGLWGRSFLPRTNPALFFPRTGFFDVFQAETTAGGPWRAAGYDRILFPSLLAFYDVAEVRTHNPLVPMPQLQTLDAAFGFAPTTHNYFPTFENIDHPFLDFLNVRAVATLDRFPEPRTLERVDGGRFEPFRIYRNPDALPRWFLPSGVDVIREDGVRSWVASLKDPRRVAVFDPRAREWVGQGGAVTLVASSPGRITLEVPGSGDRLVATSLPLPEGWRADRGGTLVVNGGFLGVRVPAGVSRIELRYRPPGLTAGLIAALAALLGLVPLLRRGT